MPEAQLAAPYEPRPVEPLGLEEVEGWRLKVYGITHEREAWVRHVLANPAGPDLDAYPGIRSARAFDVFWRFTSRCDT